MNKAMIALIGIIMVTAVMANPVSDISRSKAKADLKASLEKKYNNSYSLIETLLNAGMKSYDELCDVPDTKVDNDILEGLLKKYYPSFSLIQTLYDSNKKSYERLHAE